MICFVCKAIFMVCGKDLLWRLQQLPKLPKFPPRDSESLNL
jgi:hypothetical protein